MRSSLVLWLTRSKICGRNAARVSALNSGGIWLATRKPSGKASKHARHAGQFHRAFDDFLWRRITAGEIRCRSLAVFVFGFIHLGRLVVVGPDIVIRVRQLGVHRLESGTDRTRIRQGTDRLGLGARPGELRLRRCGSRISVAAGWPSARAAGAEPACGWMELRLGRFRRRLRLRGFGLRKTKKQIRNFSRRPCRGWVRVAAFCRVKNSGAMTLNGSSNSMPSWTDAAGGVGLIKGRKFRQVKVMRPRFNAGSIRFIGSKTWALARFDCMISSRNPSGHCSESAVSGAEIAAGSDCGT